ncbi:MAG: hypothetical protein ACE5FI_15730 [Anaerolineales bacterium]
MLIRLITRASEYLAQRRGMPTLLGMVLVILNFAVQFFPGLHWLADTNLLLHVGIVLGLAGLMIAVTLGG